MMHGRFLGWVRRNPGAPAVICSGAVTSYRDLERRSRTVSAQLRAAGIGPEQIVGAVCRQRKTMISVLLGVLRAGAVYMPLDPDAPAERNEALLCAADATVVVTDEPTRTLAAPVTVLPLAGRDSPQRDDGPSARCSTLPDMDELAAPSQAAYVIHTSGSTGRPKGVVVEHRAATAHLRFIVDAFGLTPSDRVLHLAAPHVDVAVEQVLAPLSCGAAVVTVARTPGSVDGLLSLLAAERVTVANLPAGYWTELALGLDELGRRLPPALRLVVSGSDRMPPHAVRSWSRAADPRVVLANAYGPTEAVITAALHRVDPAREGTLPTIPIGRAVGDRTLRILGPDAAAVETGSIGELHIGGPVLARGYLRDPARTALAFVPDPFGAPGDRRYRTGDLASADEHGVLNLAGRADRQVKIRGFRVEPAEVESVLARCPQVADCAVLAETTGTGSSAQLVACLVLTSPDEAAVRAFAAARLPDHLVPSRFVTVERMPLTEGGKVDHAALAAIVAAGGVSPTDQIGAQTDTERLLAETWSQTLGIPRPTAADDFFELGGDSLSAVRLITKLTARLDFAPSPYTVFANPVLRDLAANLDSQREQARAEAEPQPRPAALSHGQEGLWYLHHLAAGVPVYNVPWQFELRGPLDVDLLQAALRAVARRHEALRAVFPERSGEPMQIVVPDPALWFVVEDLRTLPAIARESALRDRVRRAADAVFDLGVMPAARYTLIRLAEQESVLVAVFHHIIWDEWSVGAFERDLRAAYLAGPEGTESALEPASASFTDYAARQRAAMDDPVLREQALAFWRKTLAGAPDQLDIPADRPRPAARSFTGACFDFEFPVSAQSAVRCLARETAATPFMVLLAALSAVLSRYTGATDLVIGSPVARRTAADFEAAIGYFVNIVPLRIAVDPHDRFAGLLARVRNVAREAFAHQDVPFELVVADLAGARASDRPPLVQVVFEMHSEPSGPQQIGPLSVTRRIIGTCTSKFDLTVTVYDGERLHGRVEYSTDLFDADRISALATDFADAVVTVVADPAHYIDDLVMRNRPRRPYELPGGTDEAAADRLRSAVSELWATVLDVDEVADNDDFFALGGHSLTAVRIVSRLSDALDRHVSPALVFDAPTVAGLTDALFDRGLADRDRSADVEEAARRLLAHAWAAGDTRGIR